MSLRTAVVTGSTSGIGLALAKALLARNINVVISARDAGEAAGVAAAIPQSTARVYATGCDVTRKGEVQALWNDAVAEFGGVDFWINNAGLALTGPSLGDLPEADLRRMLDINLIGTINGCQVALAGFLEQGKPGAIYNMLGAGADGKPVARMIGYATTKAAVTFLTRSLAAEVAGGDVVVGGLSPGLVMTEGFLREHAQTPLADRARREAVVNIIGDHPETIGRWAAKIVHRNRVQGRIFTWLTPAKIRRRAAETGRDVLSGYLAGSL